MLTSWLPSSFVKFNDVVDTSTVGSPTTSLGSSHATKPRAEPKTIATAKSDLKSLFAIIKLFKLIKSLKSYISQTHIIAIYLFRDNMEHANIARFLE
jgi:hypothetical protein